MRRFLTRALIGVVAGAALTAEHMFQAAKLTAADPSITAASNSLTTWLTDNVPGIVALVLLVAAAMLAIRFVFKRVKRLA